ncbi:PREDICTED: uncharacterized protein LOC109115428 [Nelumbo nucifera]|uniref:Uncharacterized protein LOC109115428 n=1 Tax=Nelumbo nucifera TaxID=4432 RepID=A0A1U8QA87_NELNU|nr:PREDICTED: uncharacterized protein LOC109115428 [Nelumbo nucifera]
MAAKDGELRIFMVSGEISGDVKASRLMASLRSSVHSQSVSPASKVAFSTSSSHPMIPMRPATTRHTSMARFTFVKVNSSSISSGSAMCALQLLDSVNMPSILAENPDLMIPQIL